MINLHEQLFLRRTALALHLILSSFFLQSRSIWNAKTTKHKKKIIMKERYWFALCCCLLIWKVFPLKICEKKMLQRWNDLVGGRLFKFRLGNASEQFLTKFRLFPAGQEKSKKLSEDCKKEEFFRMAGKNSSSSAKQSQVRFLSLNFFAADEMRCLSPSTYHKQDRNYQVFYAVTQPKTAEKSRHFWWNFG